MMAEMTLSGKSFAGQGRRPEPIVTPKDYAERALRGEYNEDAKT